MKMKRTIVIGVFAALSFLVIIFSVKANQVSATVVVAGDSTGNIYALGAPSGSLLWNVSIGGDTRSVVTSDNGQYIVVGTSSKVALLDINGALLWTKALGVNPTDPTPPFQFDTKLVSISEDGRYILAAHIDGRVRLYDDVGTEIWNNTFSATSVAIASDGTSAVAGGTTGIKYYNTGTNGIWDSGDSTPTWTIANVSARKVAISFDGKYIAAGGRTDGYARLCDNGGKQIWSYTNLTNRMSVDISHDSKSVVAGNDDGSDSHGAQLVYFWIGDDGNWTAADGTPKWIFRASDNPYDDVRAVAFSRNGNHIASGGAVKYSHTFLHRIESPTPVYNSTPEGHEDEAIGISFDGRYIAAADTQTPAIRLYDTLGATEPLWTYTTDYFVRSVAIASYMHEDSTWVPSAEGALAASALTVGVTSGVSAVAAAVTNPENFPSSGLAQKISDALPDTLKKWLESFMSSKTGEAIEYRIGFVFMLTKREVFSIAISIAIITFAFSYAKAETLNQILPLIPVVLATAIIVDLVKDLLRSIIARGQGVWSEYRLWYFGTIMFLVSSIVFKAPFASPSRIIHHSQKFTKRSVGLVSLTAVVVPLAFGAIFYMLFVNGFTLIGNMGLIICLTMAFFDIIPIPPMNGKDIYDWSKVLWLILFIASFALYALCLLLL